MCVPYFGGKSRMAPWISSYIPVDIETYVEPFSGAFWVYFKGENARAKTVVYNDFNPHMVNLFSCTKDHQKFLKKLQSQKCQVEATFNSFQEELFKEENYKNIVRPDYDYAMKYAYVLTQVFSGTNPERAKFMSLKGKPSGKYKALQNKLQNPKYQRKFERITNFENLDFEKVIRKYDNDKAFFYVDPPYFGFEKDGKKAYALNEFTRADHERVADTLKSIKGRFILSYYDFDGLEDMYPPSKFNYIRREFNKAAGAKKGKDQSKSIEVLVQNY